MNPMRDLLPAVEVETGPTPTHAVIWLHGLGADGSDFVPVVPELQLAPSPAIRFVFPHAPEIPVTCNGGYVMRAWYDIISLDRNNRQIDERGILASRQALRDLIARENARGIPCERIVLAGFSQGGALAYTTALTHPQRLAGVIALSTYLPTPDLVEREASEVNQKTPIFAAHGTHDDIVARSMGISALQFLQARGYVVDWHEYPLGHSVCLEEIREIGAWLRARVAE